MGYVDETERRVREGDGSGIAGVIETLQSIIIAFTIAFVFKHFVAEAYVIPTGSMAPTLLGAHLIARGPDSGYEFPLGPDNQQTDRNTGFANPIQDGIVVEDPMLRSNAYRRSGRNNGPQPIRFKQSRTRMGDRIFVQRYLYALREPRRFDVVVFKYPVDPRQNFIKRLVGLPEETLWFADGDVFTAPPDSDATAVFRVQRKPDYIQRAVWQPVYHSDFVPIRPGAYSPSWRPPWEGEHFDLSKRYYQTTDADGGSITWRNDLKPITDRTDYDEAISAMSTTRADLYAVSDIRLAANVVPDREGLATTIHMKTRGHEFQALIGDGKVILRSKPTDSIAVLGESTGWTVLDEEEVDSADLPAGSPTDIEFWHVDQSLKLWINDELVAEGFYDWDARTRLIVATGLDPAEVSDRSSYGNIYQNPRYKAKPPEIRWDFAGAGVTLHHVELDRDLYYRPTSYFSDRSKPALGTHPDNLVHLEADQFFMCGDNSPASNDGRTWNPPSLWVEKLFNDRQGIVPRELVLGKAFFVYYPSPEGLSESGTRFIPNFGQMRLIR